MKKTISIALILVLVFMLSANAFAFSVVLSPQNLTVDGVAVDCEKYNIDGSNYYKLRDIAYLLNGTGSQFEVTVNETAKTVSITTGVPYTPTGVELAVGTDNSATAKICEHTILIDGVALNDLSVYDLGGNCFLKLRDLGTAVGFMVDYDAATNTAIILSSDDGKVSLADGPFSVDGQRVACEAYRIAGSYYFKLRDIACLLMGTSTEFGLSYDAATNTVVITKGLPYEPVGGELTVGADKSATAVKSAQTLEIDGAAVSNMPCYNIGGNNFFQLNALAENIGFNCFDANGGIGLMIAADISGSYELPECAFIPPVGMTFDQWEVNGTRCNPGDVVSVDAATVVKALWKAAPLEECEITFDANGGSGTMASITRYKGRYTLPQCGFTAPDGKQFDAWSVNGVRKQAGEVVDIQADTTIKAVWMDTTYMNPGEVTHSNSGIVVDGKQCQCDTYVIDGCTFVKLRDLAALLNGTGRQFEVSYDAATNTVMIATGSVYAYPNGSELTIGGDNSASAVKSGQTLEIDGTAVSDIPCYNIGGSNFFQLDGLGKHLGFAVLDGNKIITDPSRVCTVSYDANEGTGTMDDVKVEQGTAYALPSSTFTAPNGKEFDKWKLAKTGEYEVAEDVTFAVGDIYTINQDVTFKALWKDVPVEDITPGADVSPGADVGPGGIIGGGTTPSSEKTKDETEKKEEPTKPEESAPIGEPIDFPDVQEDDWFAEAVDYVSARGIMIGMGDGSFGPELNASRAMIAQMLFNLEGAEAGEITGAFDDVSPDDWYAAAVSWMVENGIAQGQGESFGAENDVTREQLIVMLYNYAKYKGYDISTQGDLGQFSDAGEVSDWAEDAMRWAVGVGLVNGMGDGTVAPGANANRAQIAVLMQRFCETVMK